MTEEQYQAQIKRAYEQELEEAWIVFGNETLKMYRERSNPMLRDTVRWGIGKCRAKMPPEARKHFVAKGKQEVCHAVS